MSPHPIAALSAIHSHSQGSPRLVDNLMTDALALGAQMDKKTIDADVRSAICRILFWNLQQLSALLCRTDAVTIISALDDYGKYRQHD